jgi:hypothetical protein
MCGEMLSHSILLIIELEEIVMVSLSLCFEPRLSILFVSLFFPPPYCKDNNFIVVTDFGEISGIVYTL